jgi:hypothetical protein
MKDNQDPSSSPIIHIRYSDGTFFEGKISWEECSDEELLHFYEVAGLEGARIEYRERTGKDLGVTLSSPIGEIKEYFAWFSEWANRNPEAYKKSLLEDN